MKKKLYRERYSVKEETKEIKEKVKVEEPKKRGRKSVKSDK